MLSKKQPNLIFSVVFFLLTLLLVPIFTLAQNDLAQLSLKETGIWNGVYLKVRLSEKLGYYGEHHYRVRNNQEDVSSFFGRTRQIYNRAGLNLYISPYFEAVIGPTLVFNFTPELGNPNFEKITIEPRIWHQWLFIMPSFGRLKMYHQFRFEHRWKRDNAIDAEVAYTNRYRYKWFSYVPLNSTKIHLKTLYFSPSFEIFMHSGKNIVRNPFEDFRTYNGFGYILNKNVTLFVGHMWTIGQEPTGFEYKTTHILRFNLMLGLDGRRIENRLPTLNIGY